MRLPDSLLARIASSLHSDEPAVPSTGSGIGSTAPGEGISAHATTEVEGGTGQRRAFRRRVNHPVRCDRHGAATTVPQRATLLDVSAVGVCILCESVAAPGEQLVIHLPCGPEDGNAGAARAARTARASGAAQPVQTIALRCAVRSCRVRANGKFRVGAEFADATETGGAGAADASASLRRDERRPGDGRATMYLYTGSGGQAPLEQVAVRDYSERGVSILRAEPLEIGTEFVIRLPRVEDKPITRLCRVVNAAPSDGRYRIGGKFIPFPGRYGRSWLGRLWDWIA